MYLPLFALKFASAGTLLLLHGTLLIIVGLAVLAGVYLRVSSAIAVLIMLAILGDLIISFGFTDIVVRDLAILLIAAALYFDDTKYLRLAG